MTPNLDEALIISSMRLNWELESKGIDPWHYEPVEVELEMVVREKCSSFEPPEMMFIDR